MGPASRAKPKEEILFHEDKTVNRSEIFLGVPPSNDPPKLVCYTCETVTPHKFLGRRHVKDSLDKSIYTELIYECPACETERVWGTEEITKKTENNR